MMNIHYIIVPITKYFNGFVHEGCSHLNVFDLICINVLIIFEYEV